MKHQIYSVAFAMLSLFLMALGLSVTARGDLCAAGSNQIGGNWYCQAVDAVRYTNVGTSGSYDRVVDMKPDGTCVTEPHAFTGPLSPLNEEVSLHFRGPIRLKKFAAYTSARSTQTDSKVNHRHYAGNHRHGHEIHKRSHEQHDTVSATIKGQLVQWKNNWFGEQAEAAGKPADKDSSSDIVTATIDGKVVSWVNNWLGSPAFTPENTAGTAVTVVVVTTTVCPTSVVPVPSASALEASEQNAPASVVLTSDPAHPVEPLASDPARHGNNSFRKLNLKTFNKLPSLGAAKFERSGYYSAEEQKLDNLVFLGNHGRYGCSGISDNKFGSSLSYIDGKGTDCASSPQILQDILVPSETEFTIMSNKPCIDGDCGFVRPGSVAYHGFEGVDKLFLMEFSMPPDVNNSAQKDMPAIWLLNANIPRTAQYHSCSCWKTGCGEFDIVETLHSGSTYMKSTLHTNTPGGDSDFVVRPTTEMMKLAVIFSSQSSTIHLQVLPKGIEFDPTITGEDLDGICRSVTSNHLSVFDVGSK